MSQKRNYINQLPDEVLCKVFDYLELESVKNASCTCRRWNEIIFSNPYVDRFILSVCIKDLNVYPEPVISPEEIQHAIVNTTLTYPEMLQKKRKQIRRNFSFGQTRDKREIVLKQLVKTITKTKRHYRNLSWDVDEFMYRNFRRVWQAIHPKFTKHLVLFQISFIDTSLLFVYETLAKAIPLMSKLKDLLLLEECEERYEQDHTLMFRSQTVETLSLDFGYTSSIEMPKLLYYEGALSTLHQPTKAAESHVFKRMKHLTVTQKGGTSTDPSVFLRMPNLETATWNFRLGHSVFIAMCEACTFLEELCFSKQLYIQHIDALQHLYKLEDLYRLEFYDIELDDDRDFMRFGLDFDFSKMINLTELDLGKMFVADSTLERLPNTITKLGLCVHSTNERRQIEIITRNLTQLTELRFGYKMERAAPSPEVLKSLSLLEHLEELEFCRCRFTKRTFFEMDAPLHRLDTLRFKECQLETKQLLGLQQKFPSLDEPEFEDCAINTNPAMFYDSLSDGSLSEMEAIDSSSPYRGYESDSSDF
ncbi:uncharacterized protein LOC126575245 [Anopheles aquasalis]|uniref:uncharacterized protein LOC126575245 n=1 Tax=Anopheles aquasalis TaxID=42839 RepID=UPI00215A8BB6|nr:uncharacterized protein LOC126575245 [Anopheles aquasalis]